LTWNLFIYSIIADSSTDFIISLTDLRGFPQSIFPATDADPLVRGEESGDVVPLNHGASVGSLPLRILLYAAILHII
jgi:hypothetical protein